MMICILLLSSSVIVEWIYVYLFNYDNRPSNKGCTNLQLLYRLLDELATTVQTWLFRNYESKLYQYVFLSDLKIWK